MKVSKKSKSSNNNLSYGYCHVSLAALRKEPSHTSEMVSQLLFGEHFTITDSITNDTWAKIKNSFDGYEGWLHKKQFFCISKNSFVKLENSDLNIAVEMQSALVMEPEKTVIPILAGSHLPNIHKGKLTLEEKIYFFKGKCRMLGNTPSRKKIIETAFEFLHAPYLWGGRSEFGIDCSGFSQMVYKLNGVSIPRDAYQQAELGIELDFLEAAEPGDLAFFDNEQGKITHVGMIMSPESIIHASGTVHVDGLDLKGIFCRETKEYSHHLCSIKRYF
jgi:hypothetical protein